MKINNRNLNLIILIFSNYLLDLVKLVKYQCKYNNIHFVKNVKNKHIRLIQLIAMNV